MLNRVFAISIVLFLSIPATATAQDDGWLSEFKFEQLKFTFWPSGVENRQDSDGKGSALVIQADRVAITEWDALDLRHCLDGDESWCSYPSLASAVGGNGNDIVDAHEIQNFQNIAPVVLRNAIPKVDQLADMLQSNITIDGQQAKSVKITKVVIHEAEGTVDSNETAYADVEAKATYDNDKDAASHDIHVGDLQLKDDGFVYSQSIWTMGATTWKFDAGATKPEAAKKFVTEKGYFSSQDQFESLSEGGIEINAVKADGGKRSPGLEPVLLIGALLGLALVLRRRK